MTNVTQECESERVCDFVGRDGYVGCDGQHGVCRDHGIQHAGVPNVACVEDDECGRELDGLDRTTELPDAPVNALLVDAQAGVRFTREPTLAFL